MKPAPRVSDAEWEIVKFVCRHQPCNAQDIILGLAPSTGWSAATIKTLLNRLHKKGALRFEKAGKSYVYFAVFDESAFRAAEAESFLDRVFDGALSPLLSHFVQSRKLTAKELDELTRLLNEKKGRP